MALTCWINKDISQLENTIEKEVKHMVSSQINTSWKRSGSVDSLRTESEGLLIHFPPLGESLLCL